MTKALIELHGQPIGKKDFMTAIDQEIVNLNDTGDINRVMTVLNGLDDVEGITGHAKARLLWASSEWYRQHVPDEVFADHVESTTSIKKATVNRYVAVWRYVEDMTIPKEIAERPMRDLVPIASALKQGFEISKAQWKKIDHAATDGELREVIREIKGAQPKKNSRVIKLARDGSLYGWKNDKRYFIGFLNVKEAADDLVLAEFIEKIKIGAGVVEE